MRRSPRVLLAWAAAVIVMLVTARVVTGDLGALHRRAHDLGPEITVVLAARDLPLGTSVAAADLRVVARPARTVEADAVHDPAAAVGRIVAIAVLRDDVVGARHLVTGVNGIVPVGRRAVHVVVKDGFQPPVGSVVDVLATFDPSVATASATSDRAAVVASGAQVFTLAGSSAAGASDSSGSTGAGVTLLVTEAEAARVAYAASLGEVSLALAPAKSTCCSSPAP
jgi:pilus assembly protein CpaB